MAGYELDEIHRIRRKISAKFNHDIGELVAHYQKLEKEYRKAGYKFADPPSENSKPIKAIDGKAAD